MYLELIIIILTIILTHSITLYLYKSEREGCKTEYFASSTYEEEQEHLSEEEKNTKNIREKCILCNGRDNLSNSRELSKILNRLEDYYVS